MWVTSNVTPDDREKGDLTPRSNRRAKASSHKLPSIPPDGMGAWEGFVYGRRWDWDSIAREVGWKLGFLLLITTAWLFWGIETGRLIRI